MFPAWPTTCQRKHTFIFCTSPASFQKKNPPNIFWAQNPVDHKTGWEGCDLVALPDKSSLGAGLLPESQLFSGSPPSPNTPRDGCKQSSYRGDWRRHCHNTLCKYLPWIDWKVFSGFLLLGLPGCFITTAHTSFLNYSAGDSVQHFTSDLTPKKILNLWLGKKSLLLSGLTNTLCNLPPIKNAN